MINFSTGVIFILCTFRTGPGLAGPPFTDFSICFNLQSSRCKYLLLNKSLIKFKCKLTSLYLHIFSFSILDQIPSYLGWMTECLNLEPVKDRLVLSCELCLGSVIAAGTYSFFSMDLDPHAVSVQQLNCIVLQLY